MIVIDIFEIRFAWSRLAAIRVLRVLMSATEYLSHSVEALQRGSADVTPSGGVAYTARAINQALGGAWFYVV